MPHGCPRLVDNEMATISRLLKVVGLFCKRALYKRQYSAKRPRVSSIVPYATHCNTLQHTAIHCNTLRHTAIHCNTLQHTATHCNVLQHTARHCRTLQRSATLCHALQRTATHCNTLQHTAKHCNTIYLITARLSARFRHHTLHDTATL